MRAWCEVDVWSGRRRGHGFHVGRGREGVQGPTNVMAPVRCQADGSLASATLADAQAVTRASHTPYGEFRGTVDNTAVDGGWLAQVDFAVVGVVWCVPVGVFVDRDRAV